VLIPFGSNSYGAALKRFHMVSNFFSGICLLLLSTGCQAKVVQDTTVQGGLSSQWTDFKLLYDLSSPAATWLLSDELKEISGLSLSADGNSLLAVQDETGIIYWIDRQTGTVTRKSEFWKEGDYEGIEITPEALYVVKGSGTIYQIRNAGESNQTVEKFNTFLNNITADVEGLAHDALNKRLLLACKAPAGTEAADALERNVYAFYPESKTLSETPVFRIRQSDVQAWLTAAAANPATAKIAEYFSKEKKESFPFTPSAIAVHPLTGHIYLCSSGGRLLFVLDAQGALLHIAKLGKGLLPQPEGLCFDKNGDLYLSSEGKDEPATLVKFGYDGG